MPKARPIARPPSRPTARPLARPTARPPLRPTARPLALLALTALLALGPPATPARAGAGQESIFMDDSRLVYGKEADVNATLDRIRALGADRLRVSVFWEVVAPAADKRQRPAFEAADPAAYPPRSWDRYDKLVSQAGARGLDLMLNVTGPAPRWAAGSPKRGDIAKTYDPAADEFGKFVQAVGRRYDGTYLDERSPPDQPGSGFPFGLLNPSPPGGRGPLLPRVAMWSIWNEPNQGGWLTPQWVPYPHSRRRGWLAFSPQLYRRLWDAGWQALAARGHGDDTVLLGETAPRGLRLKGETRSIRPLLFLRELYCLDSRYQPFRGRSATVRDCPGVSPTRSFPRQHPGLLAAAGFAHHPYGLVGPPAESDPSPDNVVLADLPRLGAALDRIFRRYASRRRLPLHLTEYGYQTDPPDPTIGVSLGAQSRWLDQAEFIAYRNPRVRAHAQFLLYDDPPVRKFPVSDPRYWGSWQSGLLFHDGRPKPALESYQIPLFVPIRSKPRGGRFRLWGALRPARGEGPETYLIQFRPLRSRRGFATIQTATTTNPRGYFRTRFRPRRSGFVRVAWTAPGGQQLTSRQVRVRVR